MKIWVIDVLYHISFPSPRNENDSSWTLIFVIDRIFICPMGCWWFYDSTLSFPMYLLIIFFANPDLEIKFTNRFKLYGNFKVLVMTYVFLYNLSKPGDICFDGRKLDPWILLLYLCLVNPWILSQMIMKKERKSVIFLIMTKSVCSWRGQKAQYSLMLG